MISEEKENRTEESHSVEKLQDQGGNVNVTEQTAQPLIILDSGATSSVVGKPWLVQQFGVDFSRTLPGSSRKFKFGDSSTYTSLGIVKCYLAVAVVQRNGKVQMQNLCVQADLVGSNVPLLLSRSALHSWKCSICFRTNRILLDDNRWVVLDLAPNGHMRLPTTKCLLSTKNRSTGFSLRNKAVMGNKRRKSSTLSTY